MDGSLQFAGGLCHTTKPQTLDTEGPRIKIKASNINIVLRQYDIMLHERRMTMNGDVLQALK